MRSLSSTRLSKKDARMMMRDAWMLVSIILHSRLLLIYDISGLSDDCCTELRTTGLDNDTSVMMVRPELRSGR